MSNLSNNRFPESADRPRQDNLMQYVQTLHPETVSRLSRPDSHEVTQVMEQNVLSLLGGLPNEQFDVTITTSREALGQLLASAMMSGYFLRNAEQRFAIEQALTADAE
jgi:hypothetical protein